MSTAPTVGRIVHYTNLGDRDGKYPPEIQAALITKVTRRKDADIDVDMPLATRWDISLHIFYEDGYFNMKKVPYTVATAGSEEARGHWTWPVRV